MKAAYRFLVVAWVVGLLTVIALAGQSHTVHGRVSANLLLNPENLAINYTLYMLGTPSIRHSELTSYEPLDNKYWIFNSSVNNGDGAKGYDIGNFSQSWSSGDQAIVIYELEQNPGQADYIGYAGVTSRVQNFGDSFNDRLLPTVELTPIPSPNANTTGSAVNVSWQSAPETMGVPAATNVTGYNVYRSSSPSGEFVKLNTTPINGSSYLDQTVPDNQATYYYAISLVYRGNVPGKILSASSVPVVFDDEEEEETAPYVRITGVAPSLNGTVSGSVSVYGTIADDTSISSWVLKDGQGNILNSDSNLNTVVVTINGLLKDSWNVSIYPDGPQQLELIAYDNTGYSAVALFTVTINNTEPSTQNSGGQSHTVLGIISGDDLVNGLTVIRTLYLVPDRGGTRQGVMEYWGGVYYFTDNIGNFPESWEDGDEAIVFYEYETDAQTAQHKGYYGVNSEVQRREDNSNDFGITTIHAIPTPSVSPMGTAVKASWLAPPDVDNIIGYNLYRSNDPDTDFEKLNTGLIINTYYIDEDIPVPQANYYYVLQFVFQGNIVGNIYSANSDPVVPDSTGSAPAHTIYGAISGDDLEQGLVISRNLYLQPDRGDIRRGQLSYWGGTYYFIDDLSRFPERWENDDLAIVFYEYERHPGTPEHKGYYGVESQLQKINDYENNFDVANMYEVPVPRATLEGTTVRISWDASPVGEEVVGYYLYRSSNPASDFELVQPEIITQTNYEDNTLPFDQDIYCYVLKLVFSGNIAGSVYSANSNPVILNPNLFISEEQGITVEIPDIIGVSALERQMRVTIENVTTEFIAEIAGVDALPRGAERMTGNIIRIRFEGFEDSGNNNILFSERTAGNSSSLDRFISPLKVTVTVPSLPGRTLKPYFWNTITGRWDDTGITLVSDSGILNISEDRTSEICFTTEYLSYFAVMLMSNDLQPPLVTITSPQNGDILGTTPRLTAQISDSSRINTQNMLLIIDNGTTINIPDASFTPTNITGNKGVFEYDLSSGLLNNGKHNLKLIISDRLGNTASANLEIWTDTGFRLRKVLNMPNPFNYGNERTKFTYQLSAPAARVTIMIFDTNGSKIAELNNVSGAEGFNEVYWDGLNKWGEQLSNGVYLYIIEAKSIAGRQVMARGKLAVLR
ncbi:FlgD immunoglobulin-like domain containing protein [Candidatus Margulisiibacteriota bacterium]